MQHHSPEGHCEIVISDVRMPVMHLLGQADAGFAMAQVDARQRKCHGKDPAVRAAPAIGATVFDQSTNVPEIKRSEYLYRLCPHPTAMMIDKPFRD
jgi:hypothetical protein